MLTVTWLRGLVRHRPGRLVAITCGVAVAVGLLASIGAFLVASKATMTKRAVAQVGVDWQVEVQPGADHRGFDAAVTGQPGVAVTQAVEIATTTGLSATSSGSTRNTGPGAVLGLPPGYRTTFPQVVRPLAGRSDGVLLTQQTASNLQARPGDEITVGRAGLSSAVVRVDGVVELPTADSLFQKVGAPAGAQPQAPPDNVVLLPSDQWHQTFDALGAARSDQVQHQMHVRLVHDLAADPAAAYSTATGRARNLEAKLAGSGLVGDNLGATLAAARSDALYAQVLFLFLGTPGAVLAGLLTVAVAGAGASRRNREQALLRARGATVRQLLVLGVTEALLVGVTGAALGLGAAAVVGAAAFHSAAFGATTRSALITAGAAGAVGFGVAALAVALPAWRQARGTTVAAAQQSAYTQPAPWWARCRLDLILLAGSLLVFLLSGRNGYHLVLAVEGLPTVSVSYWAFAGPALLWAGGGLLAWRVSRFALHRGRGPLTSVVRPFSGDLAGTIAAFLSRQRRLLAHGVALVALTVAFAISTAVFNSTYQQQAQIDALLSNGADVTVTEAPGASAGQNQARALTSVRGVRAVEPLQHRFAYVGSDLQDLYGVRPGTIVGATKLQDAYFQGGSAQQLMDRLAKRPDGILVSAETAKDFQLKIGDLLRLRLQDGRTKSLVEVPFHFVGITKEFPTAPRDSFLVANGDYVARRTGSDAVGAFLVDTGGQDVRGVAAKVRTKVGVGATVTDLASSRKVIGSGLTAVDLAGLTRVELGFALVLGAAATGLVLWLGFAERRRTFAIATALGANSRQVAGFVWAEALFVGLMGGALGAAGGWVMSEMLVRVLTGVFDPAPASLAVPWNYLIVLSVVAGAALTVAALATVRRSRRDPLRSLREA